MFLESAIEREEDERTEIAKGNSNCRFKFDVALRNHPPPKPRPSILTRGVRCTFGAARKLRGFVCQALGISKVQFVKQSNTIHYFDKDANEYNFSNTEEQDEVTNECDNNDSAQIKPQTRVEQVLARAS